MYKIQRRPPKINEKVKVMVVEDNDKTAATEVELLSKLGFEPVRVADGSKAFEEMKILKPDILVLDLELPGKTGDQILEQILQDSELKNVPVIACSVHLQESVDPENLGNKFTRVFHKYTGAAPEMGVSKGGEKGSEASSIKDLIVEVTLACGEIFGGLPRALFDYWKKSSPYKMPPYGILEEKV
ncbi:MAG: response regulator [Candidatus Omnitrophica bacterium]|nr:response regulator [Candidatus Omnitrophota bacterium]